MSSPMIELVSQEQVLDAIKKKGPVIPIDVRQIIKMGDSITIGATLSTLVARGILKVTNLKRGGSPFYYLPEQIGMLADLSKYLGEKDRRTFELLKERKAIRDKEEEPLIRVSLRNMPDFAKRIDVEVGGEKEIFWKWYLISDDEAINILSGKSDKSDDKKIGDKSDFKEQKEPVNVQEEREKTSKVVEDIFQEKKSIQKEEKIVVNEKNEKKKKEKNVEKQHELQQTHLESSQQLSSQQLFSQPIMQTQSSLAQFNDAFITKAVSILLGGGIIIKDSKQVKKGAEYDLIIEIPTAVGNIEYFCKVKGKKKCAEADLSSALMQGQGLRLPVLFLTTGTIVKKAKEKLKTDFKGLLVKEI